MPASKALTFDALRRGNVSRLPEFKNAQGEKSHSKPDGSDWSLSAWVNATAGEAGELADMILLAAMFRALGFAGNTVKKIERGDMTIDEVREKLADELADVATYLDILAFRAGIDLGEAVASKWNRVSERVGCNIRIEGDKVFRIHPIVYGGSHAEE